MITLVGGQKGGTGKSTVAINLAGLLSLQGKDVLLIDANQDQGSASNWAERRAELGKPQIACLEESGNIAQAVLDLASRFDEVIIDTGGQDSKEFRTALCIAHVLLTPFECSQLSLDTIANILDLVSQAQDLNPQLIARSVITKAPTSPRVTALNETKELLSSIAEMPLLKTVIYNRIEYSYTANGWCVEESRNLKARDEIRELAKEIYQ